MSVDPQNHTFERDNFSRSKDSKGSGCLVLAVFIGLSSIYGGCHAMKAYGSPVNESVVQKPEKIESLYISNRLFK